jgi:hypothetical protein
MKVSTSAHRDLAIRKCVGLEDGPDAALRCLVMVVRVVPDNTKPKSEARPGVVADNDKQPAIPATELRDNHDHFSESGVLRQGAAAQSAFRWRVIRFGSSNAS